MLPLPCNFNLYVAPKQYQDCFLAEDEINSWTFHRNSEWFSDPGQNTGFIVHPWTSFQRKVLQEKTIFLGRKINIFLSLSDHCWYICGHVSNILLLLGKRICSVVKNIALITDDALDALCRANMTGPIVQDASWIFTGNYCLQSGIKNKVKH